jgi:hypothetical protein
MSEFARQSWSAAAFAFALLLTGPAMAADRPAAQTQIPDFFAAGQSWRMINTNAADYVDPPTGAKPVTNDPAWPHIGNLQPGQKTDRVADLNSPILQDWVKEPMRKANDIVTVQNKTPFVATSLCWPGGVPTQLLVPTRVFFLQSPNDVWMFWERDHHFRHVSLNREHTRQPRPQWFGESVGHYENGDTLVIDTIGLSDHPLSFVDNYRTPHTDRLHVVERWRITGGGTGIEVSFTVEDPGAFTMPWSGLMRYRRDNDGPMEEFVCAEGFSDKFNLDVYSVPTDTAPGF